MEQVFTLCYLSEGGFSYSDVAEMTRREREWLLRRIAKQKTQEAEAIKHAKGG